MNAKSILIQLQVALYVFLLTSMIGGIRAMSSITIGLILLIGFVINWGSFRLLFKDRRINLFLIAASLLVMLDLISLITNGYSVAAWEGVRLRIGLIMIPMALLFSTEMLNQYRGSLLVLFSILLGGTAAYCLGWAVVNYWETGNVNSFFYHALVSPLKQHAVFFSMLLFIALIFLAERWIQRRIVFSRLIHLVLVIFLSGFLFLLSSKLVIIFFLVYLGSALLPFLKRRGKARLIAMGASLVLLVMVSLAFTSRNPVSKRFSEIMDSNLEMLNRPQFSPALYFNGLQFRLLQWRLVSTILDEERAWGTGIGAARAQSSLDQQYVAKNMYVGDPVRKDHGFLGYNTHNQFLESLLQYGIGGMLLVFGLVISLAQMAIANKKRGYLFMTALLVAWLFTESVFETQYALLIFSFFPFFLYKKEFPVK